MDKIPDQIDSIAERRFWGCLVKLVTLALVGMLVAALAVKRLQGTAWAASVLLGFAGFMIGYATNSLTVQARKALMYFFTISPSIMTVMMYMSDFGTALSASPLAFIVGYLIAQIRRR